MRKKEMCHLFNIQQIILIRQTSISPFRSASPSRAPARMAPPPPRAAAHPPATVPPQQMMQPQQRQPGMFAQMATTAAGVAVGSAVVCVNFGRTSLYVVTI